MRIQHLIRSALLGAVFAFATGSVQAVTGPDPIAPNPLTQKPLLKFGKRLGPDPGSSTDECRARGGQPILLPGARQEDSICMGNDFVPDNLLFISLHELSHGLVHAYNIPTFAEDEDVSDKFATFVFLNTSANFAPLINSAVYFLTAAKFGSGAPNRLHYLDEHSVDEKRGSEVLCHILGAVRLIQKQNDPDSDEWIRPYRQLGFYPENQADQRTLSSCERRATKNLGDWLSTIRKSSALALEDWRVYPLMTVPDVVYEPAGSDPKLQNMASRLKAMRSLEILRKFVLDSQLLASRHLQSIRMVGRPCGTANAFFNPSTGKMTICYEMIDFLDQIESEIRSQSVRIGFGGKPIAPTPDRGTPHDRPLKDR